MGLFSKKAEPKQPTSTDLLEKAHDHLAEAVNHAHSASEVAQSETDSHNESAAYFAQQAVAAQDRKAVADSLLTAFAGD